MTARSLANWTPGRATFFPRRVFRSKTHATSMSVTQNLLPATQLPLGLLRASPPGPGRNCLSSTSPVNDTLLILPLPSLAASHRACGVLFDLERANGLAGGHPGRGIPALLNVVVGDDLVLLLRAEAGV